MAPDGTPYTLAAPDAAAMLERAARRWWVGAVLANAVAMGVAAAATLGPRAAAAWAGLLPLLTLPLLAVPALLRRRAGRLARRPHRMRPDSFPAP